MADDDAEMTKVELFAAIKAKQIDVKIIAKDDREARVTIKNNTRQPLHIDLPAAFAAVPVLARPRGGPVAATTA